MSVSHVPLAAKVHCPSCDREWIENVFHPDHITGSLRICPFPDCGRLGLHVDCHFKDTGHRTIREDF